MNFDNETVAMASSKSRFLPLSGWVALGIVLGLAGSGCGAQTGTSDGAQKPVRVVGTQLVGGPQCGGTDVHTKHIDLNVGCATCHPCGAVFGFDVPYTFPRGTTTAGGTITRGVAPAVTTCAVACHSPMGAPLKTVAWNAGPQDCTACHVKSTLPVTHPAIANPNPTGADCQACHVSTTDTHTGGTVTLTGHPATWTDRTSAGFHAYQANKGLANCQGCHGADLTGASSGVSCALCHDTALPAGVASWKVNCVMCHGGTGNQTGAPPRATWGNSADAIRVGAHATHVTGNARSPAFDCNVCHVKPADALATGHLDATTAAELTWGGLAVTGGAAPAWNRAAATCSNTYCHGQFPNGNAAAPAWTGFNQAACGSCHGLPPGGTHPTVAASLAGCSTCHPATMDTAGAIIAPSAGGKHMDGIIQVSGGGHAPGWMDMASSSFHAFSANAGLSNCQSCHGANLDGVGGSARTSCIACHASGGVASDFATCTACHGGSGNSTGAPPKATWGSQNPMAVGAHTSHVAATHALSLPFDCAACHSKPGSLTDAGHANGVVSVSGYTGTDTKLLAAVKDPGFNAVTGTCASTYCHGATLPGGTNRTPQWTVVDGTQVACGSCHGNPPNSGRHVVHVVSWNIPCWACHPGEWSVKVTPALHVNGATDMNPSGGFFGTFSNWSTSTAGAGSLRGTATGCHGGTYYWTGSPPSPRTGCN